MTIAMTDGAGTTRWATPDPGLWVASTDGEYRGVVEERADGYVARNAHGQSIGVFRRLEDAQWALDSAQVGESRRDMEGALLKTAVIAGLFAMIVAGLGVWAFLA